jgi:lipopolysaccharide/colanic/teichoic acid biosynthesis glycosyltransferase
MPQAASMKLGAETKQGERAPAPKSAPKRAANPTAKANLKLAPRSEPKSAAKPAAKPPATADDLLSFLDESELAQAFALFGARTESQKEPRPAPETRAFPTPPPRAIRFEPALAARGLQILDWVIIACAIEFAALWGVGQSVLTLNLGAAAIFLAAGLMLKAGLWLTDAYAVSPEHIRPEQGAGGLALGAIAGIVMASALAPDPRTAAALATILPLAALLLASVHAALALWTGAAFRAGAFSENIVLVGANEAAESLIERAGLSPSTRIVAVVDDRLARAPEHIAGVPVSGSIDHLIDWDGLPRIDRIIVAVTQKSEARIRAIIARLRRAPNRVDILLDYPVTAGRGLAQLSGAGLARVSGRTQHLASSALKRGLDLVLSAALIVFLAPLMALIALAVRSEGPGPIFTRRAHIGRINARFHLLSFRTTRATGASTELGAFLRRTRLDTLPALFNVLRGDMSMVGPRPHAAGQRVGGIACAKYVPDYAHRHWVRPGLVGWSRGAIDTPLRLRDELRRDLDYVARASFWLDAWILLRAFGPSGARKHAQPSTQRRSVYSAA